MRRDVILSVILHLLVIAATVVSMPFTKPKVNPEDVIRVSIRASMPGKPIVTAGPTVSTSQPAVKPADKGKALPTSKPKKKTEPKKRKKGIRPEEEAKNLAEQYAEKEIETDATQPGSPFAGATVDNANFDYPYWFEQAFNKIAFNWRNPVDAQSVLVCAVYFEVLRSGKVLSTSVEQMSGSDEFDQACIGAIERSSPFPPLPPEFADDIIGITIPFKYDPR